MLDAALAGVVVGDAGGFFVEQRAGAVGRGRDGALAFSPVHDLCGQMIDRHKLNPLKQNRTADYCDRKTFPRGSNEALFSALTSRSDV